MQLTEQDRQRLTKFYEESLAQYGPDHPKAVRWLNLHNQLARFEALCKIGDLNAKTVLDVGSGLGDLYDFLAHNFQDVNYFGIDLVPEMVKRAKAKYPQARFELSDVFGLPGKFDYILASGAMTFNVSGGKAFYFEMIAKMFELANSGVAFNLLHQSYFNSDENFLVYSPEEIAAVVEKLTKNYKIIIGYSDGDFTVHLLK